VASASPTAINTRFAVCNHGVELPVPVTSTLFGEDDDSPEGPSISDVSEIGKLIPSRVRHVARDLAGCFT
jgi:hypothetical protein